MPALIRKVLLGFAVAIGCLLLSCSSSRQVEEYVPAADAYVFWDGTDVVGTGLLCKQNDDGTASVAIVVRNRGLTNLELVGRPVLIVDGRDSKKTKADGEEEQPDDGAGKKQTVAPGTDFVHRFDTVFPAYDVKSKTNNDGYPLLVSAAIAGYRTPKVIIHMSADNMLPFRFANPLD